MKKLAIFDFDGTIADTSCGILGSIRYVQQQMGLSEISYEQKLSHIGPPMEESYARNFGLRGDRLQRAVSLHKEYADKRGFLEVQIYSGIPELLQMLKACGMLVAVATLKNQVTAERIISHFQLTESFDLIKGTTLESAASKSALIRSCMENFKVEKSDCVLVGDSNYDSVAAEELGIDFIGVTYGFGFKTKQEIANAVSACATVEELKEAIFTL